MGPQQVLLLQIRMDLGVMAVKVYSKFPSGQELVPHDEMQLSYSEHPLLGGRGYYPSLEDAFSVF